MPKAGTRMASTIAYNINILQNMSGTAISNLVFGEAGSLAPIQDDIMARTGDNVFDVLDSNASYVRTATVPLNNIKTVQGGLHKERLFGYMTGRLTESDSMDGPIKIVKYGNTYTVIDGNHRIAAAKLSGKRNVKATVLFADEIP